MSVNHIDLTKFLDMPEDTDSSAEGEPAKALSGSEFGERVRQYAELDKYDESEESIVIQVPDEVSVITPSFVSGLFGESVRHLGGVGRFVDKYKFDARPALVRQIIGGVQYGIYEGVEEDKA